MALRRPTPGLPMATNGSTFLMTPGMRSWPGRRRTGRPCRRGRGFATYAAIRQLGRLGIAGMIDRCCEHARTLVEGIGRLDGSEVLWQPRINQGLVRFLDPGREPTKRTMTTSPIPSFGEFWTAVRRSEERGV